MGLAAESVWFGKVHGLGLAAACAAAKGGTFARSSIRANVRIATWQKCAAVSRRARISGSRLCASLNSRIESDDEEEDSRVRIAILIGPTLGALPP